MKRLEVTIALLFALVHRHLTNADSLPACAQSCFDVYSGNYKSGDCSYMCSKSGMSRVYPCCVEDNCSSSDLDAALKYVINLCSTNNIQFNFNPVCSPSSQHTTTTSGAGLERGLSVVASVAVTVHISYSSDYTIEEFTKSPLQTETSSPTETLSSNMTNMTTMETSELVQNTQSPLSTKKPFVEGSTGTAISDPMSPSASLSDAAKGGITAAVILVIFILALILFGYWRRRNHCHKYPAASKEVASRGAFGMIIGQPVRPELEEQIQMVELPLESPQELDAVERARQYELPAPGFLMVAGLERTIARSELPTTPATT